MHKLNNQWTEIIDGQEHMFKVVEQAKTINADVCGGCYFGVCGDICHDGALHVCGYGEGKCPLDNVDWVVKDLGIPNASGLLTIPFDVPDRYPKYPVINEYSRNTDGVPELFQVVYSHMTMHISMGIYNTKQQAKDAWNRRA